MSHQVLHQPPSFINPINVWLTRLSGLIGQPGYDCCFSHSYTNSRYVRPVALQIFWPLKLLSLLLRLLLRLRLLLSLLLMRGGVHQPQNQLHEPPSVLPVLCCMIPLAAVQQHTQTAAHASHLRQQLEGPRDTSAQHWPILLLLLLLQLLLLQMHSPGADVWLNYPLYPLKKLKRTQAAAYRCQHHTPDGGHWGCHKGTAA